MASAHAGSFYADAAGAHGALSLFAGASTPGDASTCGTGSAPGHGVGASTPGDKRNPPPPPPGIAPPGLDRPPSPPEMPLDPKTLEVHRGQNMRKEAHRWLRHLRDVCARTPLEAVDLTNGLPDFVPALPNSPVFEWKRYVASHPQAWEIVGHGLVKFEGRFLNSPEPNARQLRLPPPFGAFRFDFCAHRLDGMCVRLHPSHGAEAATTMGSLDAWLLTACASTPSSQPPASTAGGATVHMTLGPVDIISTETAERMLIDRVRAAAEQGGVKPEEVHEDIMHCVWFDWVRFLRARPFGQTLLREGVTSLNLHCSASTPAIAVMLVITTGTHPEDRVIWFKNGRSLLY
jgi:hypothetical protein